MYLQKNNRKEIALEELREGQEPGECPDLLSGLPLMDTISEEWLWSILEAAGSEKRRVLFARALDGMSFSRLSRLTGRRYSSVRDEYLRLLAKIKKEASKHGF